MSRTPQPRERGAHLGRVVGIWRYPVKSMAPEALDEVEISWHGLVGDRRWAFVRSGTERSGFPWLTIRQKPDMVHFQPRFADPDDPEGSTTLVRTPDGEELDVTDPALAAQLGHGARVIRQNRGVFDTFPLSMISTRTVASLEELAESSLSVERFRPNFLVETQQDRDFPEDGWVGEVLTIGGAAMRVDKRDGRCAVVNVDPRTAERDPAILRTIATERDGCLGVYGSTVQPGRVAIGDPVRLDRD